MDLLVLTNNPTRASFRQRIEVYLNTLGDNNINCQVTKLPSGTIARRKLFKTTKRFDAVFLHKKCLNFLDVKYLRKYSKKIIYDFDDAVMYSAQRPDSDRSSHFRLFRRTAKLVDMIIAGNSYLADHARKFNQNVHILPTGLNIKAYSLKNEQGNSGDIRLVWIGSESTLRYLENIKPALEQIGLKFKNVTLRIICDKFFDLQNMKVEKVKWFLEKQYQDLNSCDIGLAPLLNNRFTKGKCGFKILQYAAVGLPVVASPVGVNQDYVQPGVNGYLAENMDEWVDKITLLIKNSQLRKSLGQKNLASIKEFDTDPLGQRLADLIIKSVRKPSPKVSICIPTYNRKDYLRETLKSVFEQTYRNFEVVIVDDGSTDGTEKMLKDAGYPVKYHWQENTGDAAARNKLIQLAEGEYISFLDSDDLLVHDAIDHMVNAIPNELENVIVYGPYVAIDQYGNICRRKRKRLYNGYITQNLFENILVHSCGSMFPKKVLEEADGFNESLPVCSDYDLWLRLSLKYPFIAVSKPVFKRRRHIGNLSLPSFINRKTEFDVLERFYYNVGAKKIIPHRRAMKRLAKEGYRAARAAIREGQQQIACKLLTQSFKRYPNVKFVFWWIIAIAKQRLGQLKNT